MRFTAITPIHAQPTCTATVTAVADGLATLSLAATLADDTSTLLGTAVGAVPGTHRSRDWDQANA